MDACPPTCTYDSHCHANVHFSMVAWVRWNSWRKIVYSRLPLCFPCCQLSPVVSIIFYSALLRIVLLWLKLIYNWQNKDTQTHARVCILHANNHTCTRTYTYIHTLICTQYLSFSFYSRNLLRSIWSAYVFLPKVLWSWKQDHSYEGNFPTTRPWLYSLYLSHSHTHTQWCI